MSSGGCPSSTGGVDVGDSSSSMMSTIIGIAIGTATLVLSRSVSSSPYSPALSSSTSCSWFESSVRCKIIQAYRLAI